MIDLAGYEDTALLVDIEVRKYFQMLKLVALNVSIPTGVWWYFFMHSNTTICLFYIALSFDNRQYYVMIYFDLILILINFNGSFFILCCYTLLSDN